MVGDLSETFLPDRTRARFRIGLEQGCHSSNLISLAEDREDDDYMGDFDLHQQQLGLPPKGEGDPWLITEEQRGFIFWLEAELWIE